MSKNLIYDIADKPPMGKRLIFAFQQFLAILSATIAVPAMIGLPTQIPAAIFGAGIGTLIYQLFTKFKSPVFLGSSFAFITPLCIAVYYGYSGMMIGAIAGGLVYVALAVVIHFVGTAWVSRLMPPIIIGPTVTLIGLSLAGNAMGNIVKADAAKTLSDYNLIALLCGLIAFFTIIICSVQKKYTMPKLIPFVIGIAVAYGVASIFTVIGTIADVDCLKIIDWSPVVDNFVNAQGEFVGISAFFTAPKFAVVEGFKELFTGELSPEIMNATKGTATVLDGAGVLKMIITFLPIALVVFAEHIADHKNLSSIIEKDLIEDPGLKRTLLGDGVGSIMGTLFGVCPNTTYGESVGCVAVTRNASVITITTTAFMCMILSFFSPLTSALRTIPSCVMGGVCLTLYGFIALSGLKMLKSVDLGQNKNIFVIATILIAGVGGLSIKISDSVEITTIATALILGIVTNAVLNLVENGRKKKNAQDAESEGEQA